MLLICSSCATRLQLDDAKIPAHSFTIKCPKCQTPIISHAPAAAATKATQTMPDSLAPAAASTSDSGGSSSVAQDVSAAPHFERPKPAPIFEQEEDMNNHASQSDNEDAAAAPSEMSELTRVLTTLLQRGAAQPTDKQRNASRLTWERRRALVCVAEGVQREAVARALAQNDYQTFVAEEVTQALERMREERMDVVVLDKDFDPLEQGAAFVTREVNTLRPVERRRLFFVSFNSSARTGDTHAAFINNVNLVVNPADIENLPRALERAVRDYNDLYSDFNNALNVAAL
ncbi:MAG: zinc-ribbon domain-containing protein [Pyrinomonadaceae bacterium]